MFHCGNLNERANVLSHSETLSESLSFGVRVRCLTSPQIKNNFVIASDCEAIQPISNIKLANKSTSFQSGEGVCRSEWLEILRSSSADLLQSNGLSLRMTDAFDKSNKFRHPEQSEGSLIEGASIADCSTPHPSLLPKEKGNSCCYAEHVSASLAERTGQFPSPREEGVGERVVPLTKLEILKQVQGDLMKNCAFTLAEVLITLGIIGVVAAITLPNLMTAYKARTLRSQFMKSYSLIQQAYKMMQADGIGLSPSDFDSLVTRQIHPFQTAIQPYFTGTTNCRQGSSSSVCLNDISTKGSPYLTLAGKNKISWSFFDDGQFALKDGTLFLFENPNGGKRVWLFVDINGIQGKPNKAGVDLFVFQLTDDGLKAMGDDGTDYIGDAYCATTGWSGGAYNGMSCTNKAKNDPDYFKKVVKAIK